MALTDAPWLVLLWLAGGQAGPLAIACCSLAAGSAVFALRARAAAAAVSGPQGPITVRGPASYAGPGSLGGTDSALRG